MSAQLQKRHFNVDEYYRMARAGVLKPDDRVGMVEIYWEPAEGRYQKCSNSKQGQTVAAQTIPNLSFSVKSIFGS
jgi:hypothetical protein